MDASGLLNALKNKPMALGISVALHLVLLIMLGITLTNNELPQQKKSKRETVKAFVVDSEAVEQEIIKLKKSENDKKQKIKDETNKLKRQLNKEKKRLDKVKKEKKTLEKKALDKKKLEKKKAAIRKKVEADKRVAIAKKKLEDKKKVEIKRLAEIKKQKDKKEAEVRRQAEEKKAEIRRIAEEKESELRRKAEEKEMQQRMQEEEIRLAKHNEQLASLRRQYVRMIEQKVERNWLRPASTNSDFKCEVHVTQSILGDVINVRLGSCANDTVFRNSIERAVRKSSPLPPPPNPEVFDREIRFVFKPDS